MSERYFSFIKKLTDDLLIKHKLILSFSFLIVALVIISIIAIRSFNGVQGQFSRITDDVQPLMLDFLTFQDNLNKDVKFLAIYLSSKSDSDLSDSQAYANKWKDNLSSIERSIDTGAVVDQDTWQSIKVETDKYSEIKSRLTMLAVDSQKNVPALALLNTDIEPIAGNILQLANDIVLNQPEDLNEEILLESHNLRFNWAMTLSYVRYYIASRNDEVMKSLDLYLSGFTQNVENLSDLEDDLSDEQLDAVEDIDLRLGSFNTLWEKASNIHQSDQWRQDAFILRNDVQPILEKLSTYTDQLINEQLEAVALAQDELSSTTRSAGNTINFLVVFAVIIGSAIAALTLKQITQPLRSLRAALEDITRSDISDAEPIEVSRQDELGEVAQAFNNFVSKAQTDIRDMEMVFNGVKITFESLVSGEYVNDINYSGNNRLLKEFANTSDEFVTSVSEIVHDLQIVLSSLDSGDLSIKIESKYSGIFQELSELVNQTINYLNSIVSDIQLVIEDCNDGSFDRKVDTSKLSGYQYNLGSAVNGLVNTLGSVTQDSINVMEMLNDGDLEGISQVEKIGASDKGEFRKLNQATKASAGKLTSVMAETRTVLEKAKQGDFSHGVTTTSLKGFHLDLCNGINTLNKNTSNVVSDTISLLEKISEGDLDKAASQDNIGRSTQGDFGKLNTAASNSVEKLNQVVNDIQRVLDACVVGDFSQRIDTHGFSGFQTELATGVNAFISTTQRSLDEINAVLAAIASGNLESKIQGDYQGIFADLKNSTNNSSEKLQEIIGHIVSASQEILQSTNQLESDTTSLIESMDQQSNTLIDVEDRITDVTNSYQRSAEATKDAISQSSRASSNAEIGGKNVTLAIKNIEDLVQTSQQIGSISEMIKGVSFQTNLLALNAAVEAARAGDAGRSFAIVATEVRNLALRSGESANSIDDLINKCVSDIDASADAVRKTGTQLNDIVEAVVELKQSMNSLAEHSHSNYNAVNNMKNVVDEMKGVTSQNMIIVENTARNGKKMFSEAKALDDLVKYFGMG